MGEPVYSYRGYSSTTRGYPIVARLRVVRVVLTNCTVLQKVPSQIGTTNVVDSIKSRVNKLKLAGDKYLDCWKIEHK